MKTESDYIKQAKIAGLPLLKGLKEEQQTIAICLAAVQENPNALRYAYYQTEAICIAAVSKDPSTLLMIRTKVDRSTQWWPVGQLTDAVYQAAVTRHPGMLRWIPSLKQSYALCELALDHCTSNEYKLEVLRLMLNPSTVEKLKRKHGFL